MNKTLNQIARAFPFQFLFHKHAITSCSWRKVAKYGKPHSLSQHTLSMLFLRRANWVPYILIYRKKRFK